MRNLVLNAINKLNANLEFLNKVEENEIINNLIKIHNEKIARLNKLLDCKFANVGIISGDRYFINNKGQFLTIKDNHYLILSYANVKFKIYIKDGIIKSVIPCYKNENLTMFERVHKKYSDYKRVNEQELLKFVLDHTCVQFEVIEE